MSRRSLPIAAAGLGVVALIAWLAVGRGGGTEPLAQTDPAPAITEVASPAAATITSSAPTEDAARAAALDYVSATQDWLYLSDDEVAAAVEAVSTPEAGPRLSEEAVAELRAAREVLADSPGRVWLVVRPLASKVERFEGSGARVSVWTVRVLSAADVALPQAEWLRVGLDLAWVGGSWLIEDLRETPGPTPLNATTDQPWQPEPFEEALDGYHRVGAAPPA